MTSTELKAKIDAWIEMYIKQTVDFKAPQAPTASRLNELFNLLINQGDNAAEAIANIRDFLTAYMIDMDTNTANTIATQFNTWSAAKSQELGVVKQAAIDATAAANTATTAANDAKNAANTAATSANQAATAAQTAADAANAAAGAGAYELAGGTANAITLVSVGFVDRLSKTFIAKLNNNGTATTINGKPLYKPNTILAPTIKANTAVTVWYSTSGDCFFIKASAAGNATADKVLAPYTFSNEDDTDIVGTCTLAGLTDDTNAVAADILANKTAVVKGNKITGNIPVKGDSLSTGTANGSYRLYFTPPAGYYNGSARVYSDSGNWAADNIKAGVSLFGLTGTLAIGKKFASGSVTASSGTTTFKYVNGTDTGGIASVTVSGLTFNPSVIVLIGVTGTIVFYSGLIGSYTNVVRVATYSTTATTTTASHTIQGQTSPAYVNATGFNLPAHAPAATYTWFAYE